MFRRSFLLSDITLALFAAVLMLATAATTVTVEEANRQAVFFIMCYALSTLIILFNFKTLGMYSERFYLMSFYSVILFFFIMILNEVLFHGTDKVSLLVSYFVGSVLLSMLIPLLISGKEEVFVGIARMVVIVSAPLVIPAIWGAMGHEHFFGLAMHNKAYYAKYSSIAASSGIMDFPETFGAQLAFAFVCGIYLIQRSPRPIFWIGVLALIAVGLIISQARAAILGTVVAMAAVTIASRVRIHPALVVLLCCIAITAPIYALNLIELLPGAKTYLRSNTGLSGREGVWSFALRYIGEHPLRGYGASAAQEYTQRYIHYLKDQNFKAAGASFHNTFLTRAFDNGVLASLSYLVIFLVAMRRAAGKIFFSPEARLVFSAIVVALAITTYRDINSGGMRSITVLVSVFLGLGLLCGIKRTIPLARASSYSPQTNEKHAVIRPDFAK